MADQNSEWRLVRKIKSIEGEERCFDLEDLEKSEEHEKMVPHFSQMIENQGHEIFKVEGHQIITSDGIYRILHKSEINYE